MKNHKILFVIALFFLSFLNYSQERTIKKIKISGKIVEKNTNQDLEYATVSFINTKNPKAIFGGISDAKGDFNVEINAGNYDVKVEFIGFKPLKIKQQSYLTDTNLGAIKITENNNELNEVVVRAEKTSIDIKLDKKVYNVGKDMVVKGGNASDVLQNVPSVAVDAEGIVSLRGNENVKILIDGRPINSSNLANALKSIPADSLDKVEVISNPSARYDAEGGAGIVNIVLRKGKNSGLNASVTLTAGNPKNYGVNASINYKSEKFNLFSNFGYQDSKIPGYSIANTNYYNPALSINENVDMERVRMGNNFNFGFDWYLTKDLTWTNTISNRQNEGNSMQISYLQNTDPSNAYNQIRVNDQFTRERNVEYSTNFTQKFKKQGQKLTVDGSFSQNFDNDNTDITDSKFRTPNTVSFQKSKNHQSQNRNLLQSDFVLPFGKDSQFETGYRGSFLNLKSDYAVVNIDNLGNSTPVPNFVDIFNYNEKINALYTQFGSKINKFSCLFGMRFEDSNIDYGIASARNTVKKYDNFFPSAFLTYQLTEKTNISINYSKRINRPRDRFIMPFSNYINNVVMFQGNPNINPAFTDAIEFGYLSKFDKITLTANAYFNKTKDVFQFVRRNNGDFVDATPVLISTPINLDNENRFGLELNANYNPTKWLRINGNVNIFESQLSGNYSYTLNGTSTVITQYIDRNAGSWFAKLNTSMTLPQKFNFQINGIYTAAQNTAQGKSLATLVLNLALSKDVLKDKGTLSLSVSDLFNQQKMIREFYTPTFDSYMERQGRMRQITLSFSYRFNKQKNEKERQPRRDEGGGGGDF